MYIWYEVTSDFRVLPRAVAVLVMLLLRSLLRCCGLGGNLRLIYHRNRVWVTLNEVKGHARTHAPRARVTLSPGFAQGKLREGGIP